MILRGTSRKIATLKRVPTPKDSEQFNISMYPKDWKSAPSFRARVSQFGNHTLRNSFESLGTTGQYVTDKLFNQREVSHFCGSKFLGDHHSPTYIESEVSKFLKGGISLVALSYRTPMSLINSMRTWNSSGLLSSVAERLAILSDPTPAEYFGALEHGFKVLQPKDMQLAKGKQSKPNVLTIGAAFYFALQYIQNEYLLFLESDFKIDTGLTLSDIQSQLLAAAGMLERGAEVVRLLSRKDQGCGTFKDCDHHGIHLLAENPIQRTRNWFAFYCRDHPNSDSSVADCLRVPDFRCFTSWDSNWSLNAVMVKKSSMLQKKYPTGDGRKTIPEIGLSQFQQQDGFESVMVGGSPPWMKWRVPICISYQGLFIQQEIETST